MQFAGCDQPVQCSYCSKNTTAWLDNGNDIRNETCASLYWLVHYLYCGAGVSLSAAKSEGAGEHGATGKNH